MHIGCVVFLLNVDFHYLVSNACFFKYAINSAYLFDQVENPEQSLRKKVKIIRVDYFIIFMLTSDIKENTISFKKKSLLLSFSANPMYILHLRFIN